MKQDFIRDNPQLIRALRQAQDEKTDALIEASKGTPYAPSVEFERNMERLIRVQRKPYYKYTNTRAKKALLALAAAFIIMIPTVFSVSALREPVVKFFVEVYELFSSVFFGGASIEAPPMTLAQIYLPEYIPEGYTLDESATIEMSRQAIFLYHGTDGIIEYQQFLYDSAGFTINTEGIVHEEILVGEHAGVFYSNLGNQTILWTNSQYGFSLSGPVPKEELLAMALSLKKNKNF